MRRYTNSVHQVSGKADNVSKVTLHSLQVYSQKKRAIVWKGLGILKMQPWYLISGQHFGFLLNVEAVLIV